MNSTLKTIFFSLICMSAILLTACSSPTATSNSGSNTPPPTTTTYSVGGTLTGMASGDTIILTDNNTDHITLSSNGPFTFPTQLPSGTIYNITLSLTTPTAETCGAAYSAGTIHSANITNIAVTCTPVVPPPPVPPGLTIGGELFGLATGNTITLTQTVPIDLESNTTDIITLSANGPFTFSTTVPYGYWFTVALSPTTPITEACSMSGSSLMNVQNNWLVVMVYCYPQSAPGSFATTDSLLQERYNHTATTLLNGQVLVTGGDDLANDRSFNFLGQSELYDPSSGLWSQTAALNTARFSHTATLLPNGQLLVTGGATASNPSGDGSSELYDPTTGLWITTGAMNVPRTLHSAILLQTGQVLVAGGENIDGIIPNTELYDSATGTWTTTESMITARIAPSIALLPNGKVLVSGGVVTANNQPTSSAEIYDPSTGQWTPTSSMNVARSGHSLIVLPNGQVLATGGQQMLATGDQTNSAELYNPTTGYWTLTGSLPTILGVNSAFLLPNGQILVIDGGLVPGAFYPGAYLYNPATGIWTNSAALPTQTAGSSITQLSSGTILVTGGYDSTSLDVDLNAQVLTRCELFVY